MLYSLILQQFPSHRASVLKPENMVHSEADNDSKGGAVPLPPVPSAMNSHVNSVNAEAGAMAPPFLSHPGVAPIAISALEPATDAVSLSASRAVESTSEEPDMPWEQDAGDEEGTVEAVFEADVSETEATLAALAPPTEFPMDAFIIPEES